MTTSYTLIFGPSDVSHMMKDMQHGLQWPLAQLCKLAIPAKHLDGMYTYIRNNQIIILSYGEIHRYGGPVSTAFVEPTTNEVIARRKAKKQQMQVEQKRRALFVTDPDSSSGITSCRINFPVGISTVPWASRVEGICDGSVAHLLSRLHAIVKCMFVNVVVACVHKRALIHIIIQLCFSYC